MDGLRVLLYGAVVHIGGVVWCAYWWCGVVRCGAVCIIILLGVLTEETKGRYIKEMQGRQESGDSDADGANAALPAHLRMEQTLTDNP